MNLIELLHNIFEQPLASLLVVGNLIVIESLLSIDNAAVLATMVMDLPHQQRAKALRLGIIGAYLFRGLALLFASFLVQFWFLKPLGGFYLLYLVYSWYRSKKIKEAAAENQTIVEKSNHWLYQKTIGLLGTFWATVALVELMDMAFSIDNVFAAVAFSDNILLVWFGVFIGILAMRFIAQTFVSLMEKYPFLETCAYLVIALLGVKLSFSIVEHFLPASAFGLFLASHEAEWLTSGLTLSIFIIPILLSSLKKKK